MPPLRARCHICVCVRASIPCRQQIVHDLGHPGLNNDFLIATGDALAVRYNDRAPLENHHASSLFELVTRPELNALAALTTSERNAFRKMVRPRCWSPTSHDYAAYLPPTRLVNPSRPATVLPHITCVSLLVSKTHGHSVSPCLHTRR